MKSNTGEYDCRVDGGRIEHLARLPQREDERQNDERVHGQEVG